MSILKAINTEYKGYRFRSRLEARWAVFFDACGVEWEYEPEGYDLGDGIYYLPDFLLHDVAGRAGGDLYVEVKGNMSDADAEKINRFISIGAAEAKDYGKIQTAIFVVGKIPEGNSIDDIISFICTEAYQNRKEPYYYSINRDGKFELFGDDSNYLCDMDESATEAAYRKARQARFEHGETPDFRRY